MISGRTSGNFLAGLLAILMLVLGAGPALGTTSSQGRFRPGASGVGDDYFPLAGNGGYNVAHYDLWLDSSCDDDGDLLVHLGSYVGSTFGRGAAQTRRTGANIAPTI